MSGKGRCLLCLAWKVRRGGWLETRVETQGASRWCLCGSKEEGFCRAAWQPLSPSSLPPCTQLSASLDTSVPCSRLKSSLSRLSRRELCTADRPQCSCDHHQTRGGMSVPVCMPGLCQGEGGWQEEGLFFPTPSRAEPSAP